MSNKQKAVSILALTAETCAASRAALIQTHTSEGSAPPLPVLRKDLTSILTIIHNLTTKISLTLRSSEAAYTASLAPLQDLVKYVSSFTTCATLFDAHGKTISEDIRKGSQGVLENLQVFAVAFGNIVERGDGAEEDYLVRTGAVHESIDDFRRSIPEDNVDAVRHRWAKDRSMLEDSLTEVGDMVETGGDEDREDDMDEFDDEWDELGLGSTKKMNEKELQRTKQIHPLLRMVTLLHRRVASDLLKASSIPMPHSSYDKLPQRSHDLLVAFEDAVAALYAPQDVSALQAAIKTVGETTAQLKVVLNSEHFIISNNAKDKGADDVDTVTKKMEGASISRTSAQTKAVDIKKWFDTCFEHIVKLSQTILVSLDADLKSG